MSVLGGETLVYICYEGGNSVTYRNAYDVSAVLLHVRPCNVCDQMIIWQQVTTWGDIMLLSS